MNGWWVFLALITAVIVTSIIGSPEALGVVLLVTSLIGGIVLAWYFFRWFLGLGNTASDPLDSTEPRNATRRQASRTIPSAVKRKVWARDEGRCVLCGANDDLHFDHEIPFSKGGASTIENVRVLCASCNLRKGARIE